MAQRLSKLGNRIDRSSFEERRRAVTTLVKEICVIPETISGKTTSVVTITYRFNEPRPTLKKLPAVVTDYTPGRADIMAIK